MNGPAARRLATALLGVSLLLAAAGCTGSSDHPRSDSPSSSTSSSSAAPAEPSAPLTVKVTHVAGRLSPARRATVAVKVRRTLSRYAAAAFLGGYPRRDFSTAFGAFTSGTRHEARRDQALLTNRSLGGSTTSVRAVHRTAYLSVLAPKGKVSGATAAVDWTFLVDRGDRTAQRLRLKGRLLLTLDHAGHWAIFGYDVNRSATPTGSAS